MADEWSWAACALVLALLGAYLRGLSLSPVPRREAVFGLSGFAVLAAALSPAAHAAAERGLELHMAQHVALVTGAAPLIALGRPLPALLLGLPRRARPPLARVGELLPHTLRPAGVWTVTIVHGAAFWLWHDPQLFDAALRHGAVHALEHATFVITALVYWWTIVHAAEAGDHGYVLAMLASVVTMIQGSVLGLVMLVATSPWYTVSGGASDAVSQQQGAAALMWAITGAVYMFAAAILLWRFVEEADRRTA